MISEDLLLTETLDAPPAGRLRQADALTNGRGIDAGLCLQEIEDFAVSVIDRNSLHELFFDSRHIA
jgi:hypothetical protein